MRDSTETLAGSQAIIFSSVGQPSPPEANSRESELTVSIPPEFPYEDAPKPLGRRVLNLFLASDIAVIRDEFVVGRTRLVYAEIH